MKKFFVVFAFAIGLLISSAAQASMVHFVDSGAESFVTKIQSVVVSSGLQNKFQVTNCWRSRDMDIVKDHLYGWRCKYGLKNSSAPEGDITFWADENGYIRAVRMLYNRPDASGDSPLRVMHNVILKAAGLSDTEISQIRYFEQYGHFNGLLWSNAKNRQYVIMIYQRYRTDNPSIQDWGVIFVANNDVNEAISIPQEIVTNETYDNGSWAQ